MTMSSTKPSATSASRTRQPTRTSAPATSSTTGIVTPVSPERPHRQERVGVGIHEPLVRVADGRQREDLVDAGHEEDQAEHAAGEEDRPAPARRIRGCHRTPSSPAADSGRLRRESRRARTRERYAVCAAGGPMDASESKSLPGERLPPARLPARSTSPSSRPRRHLPEATWRSVALGPLPLRDLHRRLGLLGPEGRPGDGGGDPDLDPGDRPGARLPRGARACSRT